MDYYTILGVTKEATNEEIRKAYRSAILKHHPDRGGKPADFIKIKEAYDTLSDDTKRKQYDMSENIFSRLRFDKKYNDLDDSDYNKIIKNKIATEMQTAIINNYSFFDLIQRITNFCLLDIEILMHFSLRECWNNTPRLLNHERVTKPNFVKRIYPQKLKQVMIGEGERTKHCVGSFIVNVKVADESNDKMEYFVMENDIYITVKGGKEHIEFEYFDGETYKLNKGGGNEGRAIEMDKKGLLYYDEEIGENKRGSLFVLFA
jgi:curved DNA-binding protein CbpA